MARFLELACVLLAAAAVAAAALYPSVSLLVALLACRSVSLSHCLSPCPTVTGFIAIINLLCPPVEARTNHPVTLSALFSHLTSLHPTPCTRMLHLCLAVFIKFLLCSIALILLICPLCPCLESRSPACQKCFHYAVVTECESQVD